MDPGPQLPMACFVHETPLHYVGKLFTSTSGPPPPANFADHRYHHLAESFKFSIEYTNKPGEQQVSSSVHMSINLLSWAANVMPEI